MMPLTKTLLSGCNMHDPPGYFYRIQMKRNLKNPLAVQYLTYYWNYIWQLDILVTDLIVLFATIPSNNNNNIYLHRWYFIKEKKT